MTNREDDYVRDGTYYDYDRSCFQRREIDRPEDERAYSCAQKQEREENASSTSRAKLRSSKRKRSGKSVRKIVRKTTRRKTGRKQRAVRAKRI